MRTELSRISAFLTSHHYRYVVINTLVSVLGFVRNVLFMKTLGSADLGQVALMQTIVMLIGFVQLGSINGAYILFAERKPVQTQSIANVLNTGILILTLLFVGLAWLGGIPTLDATVAPQTLIVGVLGGLCTLSSTWMNNLLIAKGELTRSNVISVVAVLSSLLLATASLEYGLTAALLSLLLQPLVVACGAWFCDRESRLNALSFDFDTLKSIVRLGLMPYLAALLTLMSYQIERWAIVYKLGHESLGQFYLVMMYMTFFVLIPASLLNIHFPKAMKALQDSNYGLFHFIRRRHLQELFLYGFGALVITWLCVPWIIRLVLPQFNDSVELLLLVFPALFIFMLRDSAALVFYSVKNTRPVFTSGVLLLVVYTLLLLAADAASIFTLETVVMFRGIAIAVSTAYLFSERNRILKTLK